MFYPGKVFVHAEQVQIWEIQTDIYILVVCFPQHVPRNAPTTSSKISVSNPSKYLNFIEPHTYQFPTQTPTTI